MDPILIFVVLPLATIIFSIALQRLLKCPILVAAIVFAVFLILAYTVFGTGFIIAAIVYAILAFITAFLTCLICRIIRRLRELEDRDSDCDNDCRCGNGENTELLTISTGGSCGNNNNNNSNYGCNNDSSNERIVLNAEVVPSNNGNSGAFRGCFRRRKF